MLEALGYCVLKSGGSFGPFDLVAWDAAAFKLIQIKSGSARLSAIEREQIAAVNAPSNATKECWVFRDRCRQPSIERL